MKPCLNRQQKRKFIHDHRKNEWKIKDWQKMSYLKTEPDGANKSKTVYIYSNDIYLCVVKEYKDIIHLSIKRHDLAPVHNWQHLQQIKNDICGEEREGVELYPAMGRIVDTANLYHLWVLRKGRIDLGFKERAVLQNNISSRPKSSCDLRSS